MMNTKVKPKVEVVDLFCGIGGLSYGLKQANIDVKAGLDNDPSCQYAYEKNVKADFIHADIAEYDFSKLKKYYSKDSVKVLVGCAPCQPFSQLSKDVDDQKDDRWNLINYFTKATEEIRPEVISMENVRGLTRTVIFKEFVAELEKLGYHIEHKVVFCPDYGIPQNRHRLVLLGALHRPIRIPKRTHTKYETVRNAIGHLPPLNAGEQSPEHPLHKVRNFAPISLERIKQSKPNGTWRDWEDRLLPNCYRKESGKAYTSVYGRMSWDNPAPTITTQFHNYGSGRFGHPEQDRTLSLIEGALLQTFPEDYDFGECKTFVHLGRYIGNAVPPRLGKVIGDAILEHLREVDYV